MRFFVRHAIIKLWMRSGNKPIAKHLGDFSDKDHCCRSKTKFINGKKIIFVQQGRREEVDPSTYGSAGAIFTADRILRSGLQLSNKYHYKN